MPLALRSPAPRRASRRRRAGAAFAKAPAATATAAPAARTVRGGHRRGASAAGARAPSRKVLRPSSGASSTTVWPCLRRRPDQAFGTDRLVQSPIRSRAAVLRSSRCRTAPASRQRRLRHHIQRRRRYRRRRPAGSLPPGVRPSPGTAVDFARTPACPTGRRLRSYGGNRRRCGSIVNVGADQAVDADGEQRRRSRRVPYRKIRRDLQQHRLARAVLRAKALLRLAQRYR